MNYNKPSRYLRCLFLFVFIFVILGLTGCQPPQQDPTTFIVPLDKYDVRILRDSWGVPHIFGKRDADVAFGLAYAHCEDDWKHMEDAMLTVRGLLASKEGLTAAKFDYVVHWFRIWKFIEEKYDAALSPEMKELLEAYAEGITHFAALHPDKMPLLQLPVTGKDIVAGVMIKAPFFYELHRSLTAMMGRAGVSIDKGAVLAFRAMENNPFSQGFPIGSNAWAVGPTRSADGATRLAINSHMPWEGQVTWYEAQAHSEEGWDVIGATFPGGPLIFKGHNANMGWCHTINRPGLADIYELKIHPDNPNLYEFDGEWRELERDVATIRVRLWGNLVIPIRKEMLWSVHGPAIRSGSKTYALRFVGYGDLDILEQWRMMNKAQNLDQFLAAMNRNSLLSFNTLYADKEGHLFYAYCGKFPNRSTAFNWNEVLPGNTSEALWTEYYPFSAVPQVLDPPSAFVQTCNSSPFYATVGEGNPRPEDFCPSMRIETHLTNRSRRALALYGTDDSITREEFYRYKYDKQYDPESRVGKWLIEILQSGFSDDAELQEAFNLLEQWDRSAEKDTRATALAMLALELPPAEDAPPEEPRNLRSLRSAVRHLKQHFGKIDIPWEEVLRLRRGKLDLGIGGCPDCLRAIDIKLQPDGRFTGINGDCFFQMVEWAPDGTLRSESIHQYGTATVDETSPHFADQAPLFANEQMRPTLYYEKDIREHLVLEYRPGEFTAPWHVVAQANKK